jgi:hypothetical protein
MTLEVIIQIIGAIILFATLLLLFFQIRAQNMILKAQLNRDRFEMYWKTYDPITKDEIKEFEIFPEDYIDLRIYKEKYENNNKKIIKYLMVSKRYDYLAFSYNLKKLKLRDTLGFFWTENWIKDLIKVDEFLHVHEFNKEYYPELTEFIDNIINSNTTVQQTVCKGE